MKSRAGRPPIPQELRELIRRMARENVLWGEERIANELLLKLGIRISPRTVRKYLPKRPPGRPRGDLRWSTFLRVIQGGSSVLRKNAVQARRCVPGQVQGRTLWHDERMVTLVRIALRLIEDALRWVLLLFRSTGSVQTENLFLLRQLALYIERGVQPHRVDAASSSDCGTTMPTPTRFRGMPAVAQDAAGPAPNDERRPDRIFAEDNGDEAGSGSDGRGRR